MKKTFYAFLIALLLALSVTPAFAQVEDDEGRVVFGQDVTIQAGEEVEGDLVVFDGDVVIEEGGKVDGDLVAIGGDVEVAGEVDGDLAAIGGNVRLAATAIVDGDLAVIGGRLHREEGAVVEGQAFEGFAFGRFFVGAPPPTLRVRRNVLLDLFLRFLQTVVVTIALVALALLVVLFLPQQTQLVSQTALAQALPSLGVGFLTVLVVSVLVPLLTIICVGIPAAFLLVLALVAAGLFGWIAVGLLVGEKILEALKVEESLPLVAVAIGVLLISFLGTVPCIGWVVALFGGLLGLGAVVLTRFGTQVYPAPSRPTPPQAPLKEEPSAAELPAGD
ncbi:MAG TPA: polymer-forming cytoskeletal protein [Anaerolineae bacterium]|nr:polymer-forming cytoskeletal protein [Anaerolineae bacterium]